MRVPWGRDDWNRVVVYGMGSSGIAATRLLRSRGVEVIGLDSRPQEALDLTMLPEDPGVRLVLGEEPKELPWRIDGVVVSPGVPPNRPLLRAASQAGLPVVAEVELAFLFVEGEVIGVTGSNGKSTTTQMVGALLGAAGFEVEVCGNIGVPLSARVEGAPGRKFVVELSSFQLDAIEVFHPRAAALLNLSVDHLDWHGDVDHYYQAKTRIFRNQDRRDVAVLNADDEVVARVAVEARRRFFSRQREVEDGCYLDGDIVVEIDPEAGRQELFKSGDVPLPGPHNLENAMAAALLCLAAGGNATLISDTLAKFRGLPHRLQRVVERNGVVWFDDSKATNFAATAKSLEGFEDRSVHLILGGRNKGGDASELADVVSRKAKHLYLVGDAAEEIGEALGELVETTMSGNLASAVAAARETAVEGEIVLLSPACASFDQYRDFAERGDHFQELARALDG